MNNIDKIRQEIESRIAFSEKCANAACEKNLHNTLEANELLIRQYKSLLAFINTLSEEKPSEDLKEVAEEWAENEAYGKSDAEFEMAYKGFIAGTEWQRKKDRETIELAEEHAILAGRVQMKEEMIKEIEKDTLFLERAWLTLYNLGYEELAERLKTFKEKYANKV